MKEGNQLAKLLLLVVPVGLAAGILLPYAVVNSDKIASAIHRESAPLAPEIVIDRREVRDQPLPMPKRVASLPIEMKLSGRGRVYFRKRGSRRRHSIDARTRKRLQRADQDAWRDADRMLHAERTGMM